MGTPSISGIHSSDGSILVLGGGDTVDLRATGSGGGVELGGDIGGTNLDPLVVGFQGVPVSGTPATSGQVYVLTAGTWVATSIPLGITPGTGIGASASAGVYTITNTGVLSFNTRTGAVTLTAADIEALFTAQGQLFVGTGSGTGALLGEGTTGQVLTVKSDGSLFWATPASAVISVFGRTGAVTAQSGDYTVSQVTGAAPLASPALTGTPTAPTASPLTDSTQIATTAYADLAVGVETTRAEGVEAHVLGNLALGSVQTASFNIAANTFHPVSTASGAVTATIPNAPADGTVFTVFMVAQASTNAVTLQAQGSDVFNVAGGTQTKTITFLFQGRSYRYQASTKIWYEIASQVPLGLFATLASPAFTGVPTAPTASAGDNTTQIATDAFVTTAVANAIAGVNPAVAVVVATTQTSDTSGLTYNNGVSGVGATLTGSVNTAITIDGVTLTSLNQRVLVKNDTQSPSGAFNGVYTLTQLQTSLLAPILTRALDYDQPSDINNTGAIPVTSGTANANTSWVQTAQIVTVGTSPLTFTQFTLAPSTLMTKSVYDAAAIAQQVVGTTATQTVSGKRITKRVTTTNAPGATPTINSDTTDLAAFTGLAAAITSMTTNLSGTPNAGDLLWIQLTDNGTARAITWGSSFEASGNVALPTTTVISTALDVLFRWNTVTSKWRCIAVS